MAKVLPDGSFQITDGPSKFDLMCSLFDGKKVQISCDILNRPPGGMKISQKLKVRFRFVGAEDGSHESWVGSITLFEESFDSETRKFYYNSRTRKGVVHDRKIVTSMPNPLTITSKF